MDDIPTLFEPNRLIADFNAGTGYFEDTMHAIRRKNYELCMDGLLVDLRRKGDFEAFSAIVRTYDPNVALNPNEEYTHKPWYITDILAGVINHCLESNDTSVLKKLVDYFGKEYLIPYFLDRILTPKKTRIGGFVMLSKEYDIKKCLNICDFQYALDEEDLDIIKIIISAGFDSRHREDCSCMHIGNNPVSFRENKVKALLEMKTRFDGIKIYHWEKIHKNIDLVNSMLDNGLSLIGNNRIIMKSVIAKNKYIINHITKSPNYSDSDKTQLLQKFVKCLIKYPAPNYTVECLNSIINFGVKIITPLNDPLPCFRYEWCDDDDNDDDEYATYSETLIKMLSMLKLTQDELNKALTICACNHSTDNNLINVMTFLIKKGADISHKSFGAFHILLSSHRVAACRALADCCPKIYQNIDEITEEHVKNATGAVHLTDNAVPREIPMFLGDCGAHIDVSRYIESWLYILHQNDLHTPVYSVHRAYCIRFIYYLINCSFILGRPCPRSLFDDEHKDDKKRFYKVWDDNKKDYIGIKSITISPIS